MDQSDLEHIIQSVKFHMPLKTKDPSGGRTCSSYVTPTAE
jgi:hypothetical protein